MEKSRLFGQRHCSRAIMRSMESKWDLQQKRHI